MHALIGAMRTRLGISGGLSATNTGSTVTSATRTIRGSGLLLFDTLGGTGTPQYALNGGGSTNITEGMTLAVGTGQTISVLVTGLSVGQSCTFNVKRNLDGALLDAVTLERIV